MKLFERSPTRSDRVRWTLLELDMPFESVTGEDIFANPELRKVHPLGKLPAMEVDGKGLFESAAICTWLADQAPEKGLIAATGSWNRGLHDQWVSFALAELEPWLWSRFRNTVILSEDMRVPEVLEQNAQSYRESAAVLDAALAESNYLVGDSFSVTDIIVSFTCHFGSNQGLNDGFDNINGYLARMKDRPLCPYGK